MSRLRFRIAVAWVTWFYPALAVFIASLAFALILANRGYTVAAYAALFTLWFPSMLWVTNVFESYRSTMKALVAMIMSDADSQLREVLDRVKADLT